MTSQRSFKCLSFLTKQDSKQSIDFNNRIVNVGKNNEPSKGYLTDNRENHKKMDNLRQDISNFKKYKIQCKNAIWHMHQIIRAQNSPNALIQSMIKQIELQVIKRRNYELFVEIMTRESDEQFHFSQEILITKKQIQALFSSFDYHDFNILSEMIREDNDMILWRNPYRILYD